MLRASRDALRLALRLGLTVMFVASGAMKLSADPGMTAAFDRLGVGQGLRVLVGILELLGAAGLMFAPTAAAAAAGLALVMMVVIPAHPLALGGNPNSATLTLLACLWVTWLERSGLGVIRVLVTGKGPMDGWLAHAYDRGIQNAFREIFPPLVEEHLSGFRDARRILDAGCGPGQFTILLAEALAPAEIWGIDLAPGMIEIAKRHQSKSPAASRLHFEVADVARLPFPDGHFDGVVSSGSIKHWPDPVAGLRELYRVLAPGGRALVAELNRAAPAEGIAKQRARSQSWIMRRIYPRAISTALAPKDARQVFAASPFGPPQAERMLLDGCLWLFEVRKAN